MIEISKDTHTTPITPQQARNIIQGETDAFGVVFNYDRIMEYHTSYAIKVNQLTSVFKKMTHNPNFKFTIIDDLCTFLVQNNFMNSMALQVNGKWSFDQKKRQAVREDPDANEDLKNILELYDEGAKARYMMSYLGQYASLPLMIADDMNGDRCVVAHPEWRILSTSRISAQKPSIQNVSKNIPDIITAPKGYNIIRSDSGQIEPRIVYSWQVPDPIIQDCIRHYGDAYFGLLAYCYLPEEAFNDWNPDKWLKPINDEFKAKRQSLKTLTNAANYGSGLKNVEPNLRVRYENRVQNNPYRLQLLGRIENEVRSGQETFYGYFGTPVTPESTTKHVKGGDSWAMHLQRCAINNPIQTTASELMMFSINEAQKLLKQYRNVHLAYYKHDESCFYVPEDLVQELKPKIQGIMSYHVEGWLPISSDVEAGKKKGSDDVPCLVSTL